MNSNTGTAVSGKDDTHPKISGLLYNGMTKSHMNATGEKIRCHICEKWKDIEQFSNKNAKKYRDLSKKGKATATKSGVPCRQCSGEPPKERICEGPCGKSRPLTMFSKTTRRKGTNWCMDCTDWQLAMEPGELLPAPGMMRSADEIGPMQCYVRTTLNGTDTASSDNVSSVAHSTLAPGSVTSTSTQLPAAPVGASRPLLGVSGHWALPPMSNDVLNAQPIQPEQPTPPPPWAVDPSQAWAPEPPAPTKVKRAPVSFNAYDPNGRKVRMIKQPTLSSATQTDATTTQGSLKVGKSGWTKIPGRKTQLEQPNYLRYDYENPGPSQVVAEDSDGSEDSDY